MRWMAIGICGLLLGGCAAASKGPKVVQEATEGQESALLGQVKQLEGTWTGKDAGGDTQTIVFAVSSNGSIVREIMLPGTDHEMTNIYHMDGPDLVMTHYCAMGNQPRLRAGSAKPGEITLACDSVTNMTGPGQMYMGGLTLVMKDKNHLIEKWTSITSGKPDHHASFELTRTK